MIVMADPKKPREGETIGGGYFIFRRGERTKRIRGSPNRQQR